MQVKICGITRPEDARAAAERAVDALGFIFYEGSPRNIDPDAARSIIETLPPGIVRVGVFVNEDHGKVQDVVDCCGLDMVQLHGDESPGYAGFFDESMVIKAFDPQSDEDIHRALLFPARAILVDARDGDRYGGTGKQSNWNAARAIGEIRPLILAGGIGEDTLHRAVERVFPAAVDLNSGVEREPGIKDHEKMDRVLKLVRNLAHGPHGPHGPGPFLKRVTP